MTCGGPLEIPRCPDCDTGLVAWNGAIGAEDFWECTQCGYQWVTPS